MPCMRIIFDEEHRSGIINDIIDPGNLRPDSGGSGCARRTRILIFQGACRRRTSRLIDLCIYGVVRQISKQACM